MAKEAHVNVIEVVKTAPSASNISGSSNIGGVIVSEVGPKLALVSSPAEFLKLYTKDGVTIPRNAHISLLNAYYLSYAGGLVLSRAMNTTAVSGLIYYAETDPVKVTYKGNSLLSKKLDVSITFDDPIPADSSFVLNDVVFYKGDLPANIYDSYEDIVQFSTIEDIVAEIEGWDDCHASYSLTGSVYKITIEHDPSVDFQISSDSEEMIGMTVTLGAVTDSYVVPAGKLPLFTIRHTIATGDDSFKVKVTNVTNVITGEPTPPAGAQQFVLTIDAGENSDASGTYTCSLHPMAVDANGQSIYIEYLNDMNIDFEVEVFEGVSKLAPKIATVFTEFGDSGLNLDESSTTPHLMSALSALEDQEIYEIEALAPFGITALPFVKRLVSVGIANKWFTPIDVPYTASNKAQIRRYVTDLGIDTSNSIVGGSFDRNNSLTGWTIYIAWSTLYWERVLANKGYNAEFAPVFKEEYGSINFTNPTKLLTKKERESLLDLGKKITWVRYNQRTAIHYMNDNSTHYSKTDVLSEEQNRRLVNKIQKDLRKLVDPFLAKYNTRQTRMDVNDVIENYFRNNIMNKKFAPAEYQIICDESNNTEQVIRDRKLAITVKSRLYNSIKEIDLLNELYPIGVPFMDSI